MWWTFGDGQLSAATEVMGFLHMFGDARMPIWGISAMLSNILLVVFSRTGQRWFYAVSVLMLLSFVVVYNRLSKPVNRLQTESGKIRTKPRQWSRAPGLVG